MISLKIILVHLCSDNANDGAGDGEVGLSAVNLDWGIAFVAGDKLEAGMCADDFLDRGFAIEIGDGDGSGFDNRLQTNDDVVAIHDAEINHAVAFDDDGEKFSGSEYVLECKCSHKMLDGKDRSAGRHGADDGDSFRERLGKAYVPGAAVLGARDVAFAFEYGEVVLCCPGRCHAEMGGYLAYGRRAAVFQCSGPDEPQNLGLSFCQWCRIHWFPPLVYVMELDYTDE
jgi:hypothetical protein